MTQGILDKGIFKKPSIGLIHTVFNDLGYTESQKFIDNIQGVITQYLLSTGFSVGISDLVVPKEVKEEMKNEIKKKKDEIKELNQSIHFYLRIKKGIPIKKSLRDKQLIFVLKLVKMEVQYVRRT